MTTTKKHDRIIKELSGAGYGKKTLTNVFIYRCLNGNYNNIDISNDII